MNQTLQSLFALLAALSAASGGVPQANSGAAFKPAPIVAPAPASIVAPQSAGTEVVGKIQTVKGNVITINGKPITLAPNAQVKVKLAPGAMVKVDGSMVNGKFVAREVSALENQSAKPETEKQHGPELKIDDKSSSKSGADKSKDNSQNNDNKKDDGKKDDNRQNGDDKKSNDKGGDSKQDSSDG